MNGSACIMQGRVDAHFAGTIAPTEERAMRTHLGTCDACRSRYRRQRLLAKLDPQALSTEARLAQGLGLRKSRVATHSVWPTVGAVVAVAAAVLLLLRVPKPDDGFEARGTNVAEAGSVAPPVHVYRVPRDGRPVPILDPIASNDELAFAYENRDRKSHLMIFAVNERGRVYWFYPGWTNPADNPRAIPITQEPGLHTLPDAVVHRFEGSKLDIHTLFLDDPRTVREIEEAFAAGSFSVSGAIDHVQTFRVVP